MFNPQATSTTLADRGTLSLFDLSALDLSTQADSKAPIHLYPAVKDACFLRPQTLEPVSHSLQRNSAPRLRPAPHLIASVARTFRLPP